MPYITRCLELFVTNRENSFLVTPVLIRDGAALAAMKAAPVFLNVKMSVAGLDSPRLHVA